MSEEYIDIKEYWYLMNRIAYWVLNHNDLSKIKFRDLYGYFGQVADQSTLIQYIRNKGTDKYMDDKLVAEFVECLIYDNGNNLGFMPNYVTGSDGTKYYLNTYVNMANRVSAYEVLKGFSPRIVYIKKENSTSGNVGSVLDEFEKRFGICKTFDDALYAVKGRGYLKYFDSQYNTMQTIERIEEGDGTNCTDAAQLFYRLAYGINEKYGAHYEVQFVHVKCQSGVGHVRLRLRNGGDWFYRDPAAVLDGESVTSNWCSNGYLIAYNPAWIFDDLYQ